MNFLFLGIFSRFLWIYFLFKSIKMNLKKCKKRLFTARGHVDATWHSGPRGSATRAHAAYSIYIIYLLYIYKMGL